MRQKRYLLGATFAACAALSLGVWQTAAGASARFNVSWTMRGSYTCINACAETTGQGTARSDSRLLGDMAWTNHGTGAPGTPDCTGGVNLAETWEFTTQNHGDTLDVLTLHDAGCPSLDNPSFFYETASFAITGGTGRFSGASGTGTFQITDLADPTTETGTFYATVTGIG
jgi:hypothetical protein